MWFLCTRATLVCLYRFCAHQQVASISEVCVSCVCSNADCTLCTQTGNLHSCGSRTVYWWIPWSVPSGRFCAQSDSWCRTRVLIPCTNANALIPCTNASPCRTCAQIPCTNADPACLIVMLYKKELVHYLGFCAHKQMCALMWILCAIWDPMHTQRSYVHKQIPRTNVDPVG